MPIVLAILFVTWALYRLFIKKDLLKNKDNLYAGVFFIAVWVIIYYFIW